MTALDAGDVSPGDRVYDRDDDDANDAVVVRQLDDPADQVTVPIDGEPTVADVNPDYPADATVVEVAFTSDLDREVPGWRDLDATVLRGRVAGAAVTTYSYPAPRLRRAADGGTWR